nr:MULTISPECIES: HNH endonuclease [unclassified Devosia]
MKRPSARSVERAIRAAEETAAARALSDCPLCGRPIPTDAKSSRHHLTPRLKGGTHMGTVHLHQICHSAIHARFSESEIAQHLNDVERLKADPEMAKFIVWVQTKPPMFHAPTRQTRARR